MKKIISSSIFAILFSSCEFTQEKKQSKENIAEDTSKVSLDSNVIDKSLYQLVAHECDKSPKIDGDSSDKAWKNQPWYSINHTWLGKEFTKDDFEGRFKLSWDKDKLYVLVEIKDDSLMDIHDKWDDNWWNDDCVEIFIDEDNGDDLHQFNHKAFAYHIALNCKDVVDLGADEKPHLYNDHIKAAKNTVGKTTVWEFAIDVYDDTYVDGKKNKPVKLKKGKEMGFTINYCDNDKSPERENFISSIPVAGEDKDLGWKDASVFNDLILKK